MVDPATRAELRRRLETALHEHHWAPTDTAFLLAHLPALLDEMEALERFHDAWTEHQCGLATGDPEIAREKKKALMAAQKAVLETRK